MTGDPATQEWREAMSAALQQTQQALAKSQQDLTRAEQDRAEAVEMSGELAKALFALSLRLDRAEKHDRCAWRELAEKARAERDAMRAQLAEASGEILHAGGRIYAARQDSGPCPLCGLPILRGWAVEAGQDGDSKPCWIHAVCPDGT